MTLILGGSGQLGTSFRKALPDALTPSRSQLDVTDVDQLGRYLDEHAPRCIINCSGFTDVDGAETAEGAAMAVNATAVGDLAYEAERRGIPLVTFSSDYVFDGKSDRPYVESDATNPINVYGRSKVAGEHLALQHPHSLIVRTSWLFSATHPNFVASILRRASAGEPLRVVDDQIGRPTHVDELAAATMRALELGLTGVLHLASSPIASWHQLARAALEAGGLDPLRAKACTTGEYPTEARRPAWSVLGSARIESHEGLAMPDWTIRLSETVAVLMRRLSGPVDVSRELRRAGCADQVGRSRDSKRRRY